MRKLSVDELNRISVNEFQKSPKLPLVVLLDNVRSMNNVGSVFRTCDAFRIEKIILAGITARPPHKEIEKTALGATESVVWEYYASALDAVKELKKNGYEIIAVEQVLGGLMLQEMHPETTKKYVLIFGNEITGVSDDVVSECDAAVEIPQFGTKHSFNIAVSAGIVLWHFWSNLNKISLG